MEGLEVILLWSWMLRVASSCKRTDNAIISLFLLKIDYESFIKDLATIDGIKQRLWKNWIGLFRIYVPYISETVLRHASIGKSKFRNRYYRPLYSFYDIELTYTYK